MFIIRDYHTNEIVGIATRKEDAVAMTTAPRTAHDPVLVYEEAK
jgi:hypothetical protein